MTKGDCLKASEIFENLDDDAIGKIAKKCEVVKYNKDQMVFEEGAVDDHSLYVVMNGEILISTELVEKNGITNKDAFILALMEPGDTFGEIALIDHEPRTATARASKKTTLVRMPEEVFGGIMANHSNIGVTILRNIAELLCRRLREMDFAVKHQTFKG